MAPASQLAATYGDWARKVLLPTETQFVSGDVTSAADSVLVNDTYIKNVSVSGYPDALRAGSSLTLLLRSSTTVSLRFAKSCDPSAYDFYFSHPYSGTGYTAGAAYQVEPDDDPTLGYYYVNSKGIPASKLGEPVTFTIKNHGTEDIVYQVTYSPYIYGRTVLVNANNSDLMNMVRAMYNYNEQAILKAAEIAANQ